MDAASVALVIAGGAVAIGLVACVALARQRPRARRASQTRHPASAPPISVSLVREGRVAHWRVELRTTAAPTGLDILSYRATATDGDWESEPIVEPVELRPGGWAVLPSAVVGRSPSYDVVLGWTEHRSGGDRTGSATLTVTESGPVIPVATGPQRGWVVTAVVVAIGLLATGAVVVGQLFADDDPSAGPVTTPPTSASPTTTSTPDATVVVTTTVPTTTDVSSTGSASPVTTTTGTTATTRPSTTAGTSTTIAIGGPSVTASGRIEDCRFGTDCLVVGFTIADFDTTPAEYVCEFADGERVTFGFVGDGAETACSARSADPSITIEVDGVRSNTVTPDDLG